MSNDFGGRSSRTTASGPSMGSGVAIFVTAVALVLGFLVLRKVNDSGTQTVKPDTVGTEQTTPDTGSGFVDPNETSTTTIPQTFTGTKVQVANASGQNGVARMMTTALLGAGFTMSDATNGTANPPLAISKVLYKADDPAAKPVADTLAQLLGGLAVEAASLPLPVTSAGWSDGSGVILLLGNDLAGKTLSTIQGTPATGTTIAPVVT